MSHVSGMNESCMTSHVSRPAVMEEDECVHAFASSTIMQVTLNEPCRMSHVSDMNESCLTSMS